MPGRYRGTNSAGDSEASRRQAASRSPGIGSDSEPVQPATATWYRMILARLGRAFEADQGVDGLTAPAVRGWIVELQATLAPVSIAGYVRTLKVFGNSLHAEELADAAVLRPMLRPSEGSASHGSP